jgi:hypothetical protein
MRFLTAITLGVVSSALALGACSEDQSRTGPTESPTVPIVAPSFSMLSTGTTYRITFTCNTAAAQSVAQVTLYNGGSLFGNIFPVNCGYDLTWGNFDSFTYDIHTGGVIAPIKECDTRTDPPITRTGKFSCNRQGYVAALTIRPV